MAIDYLGNPGQVKVKILMLSCLSSQFLLIDIIIFHTLLKNMKSSKETVLLVIFNQVSVRPSQKVIIQTNEERQHNP